MTQLLANTHGFELSTGQAAIIMGILVFAFICFAIGCIINRRKSVDEFKAKRKLRDYFDNEEHLGI